MKFLVIGDLHLDAGQHLSRTNSLHCQMLKTVLFDIIDKTSILIDKVIFLGDIWNNNKPAPQYIDIFTNLVDYIKLRLHCDIVIVSGNHDYAYDGCITTTIAKLAKKDLITIEPHQYSIIDNIAYVAHGCLLNSIDLSAVNILFGHFSVASMSRTESNYIIKTGELFKYLSSIKLSILGDIHKNQQIATNAYHVGTPYPIKLNDNNDHYYGIVDTDAITWTTYQTIAPRIIEANDINYHKYNDPKYIVCLSTLDMSNIANIQKNLEFAHQVIVLPTMTQNDHSAQTDNKISSLTDEELLSQYIKSKYVDTLLLKDAIRIKNEAGI